MMNAPVCPFLGLKEDPGTTLSFPSDGNCCHKVLPVVPVRRDHQVICCLTPEHPGCPVFQRAEISVMPDDLVSPQFRQQRQSRGVLAALVIGLVILGALGLSSLLRGRSAAAALTPAAQNLGAGLTPTSGAAPMAFPQLFGAVNTPTETLPPPQETPVTATPQACLYPQGWEEYAVKAADSTFRLSVVFRVTVDDLLRGNCLKPGTVLRPGQTIFVPPLPTATATPTATLTPTPTRKATFTPTWTPRPRREDPAIPPTATRRPVQPTERPTEKPTDKPTNPPPTPRPPDTPTPAPLP